MFSSRINFGFVSRVIFWGVSSLGLLGSAQGQQTWPTNWYQVLPSTEGSSELKYHWGTFYTLSHKSSNGYDWTNFTRPGFPWYNGIRAGGAGYSSAEKFWVISGPQGQLSLSGNLQNWTNQVTPDYEDLESIAIRQSSSEILVNKSYRVGGAIQRSGGYGSFSNSTSGSNLEIPYSPVAGAKGYFLYPAGRVLTNYLGGSNSSYVDLLRLSVVANNWTNIYLPVASNALASTLNPYRVGITGIDNWGFLFAGEVTNRGSQHTLVTAYSTTGQQFSYRTSSISANSGPFRLVGAYSNTGLVHLLVAGTVTNTSNSLGSAMYRSTDLGSSWQPVVGPWNSNAVIRVSGDTNSTFWPGSNSVVVATANGIFTSAQGPLPLILTNQMRSGFPIGIYTSNVLLGQLGVPFQFQITASNQPISFGASNLPPGLTVTSNGLISGTITNARTNQAFLLASNLFGSTSLPVAFAFGSSPAISPTNSSTNIAKAVGQYFSSSIYFSGSPTSCVASNLPLGLTARWASRLYISGVPEGRGTNLVSLIAANIYGVSTSTVSIRIGVVPLITTGSWVARRGVATSLAITATENPTSFSVSGLPPGLIYDSSLRAIVGSPTLSGSFPLVIRATNEFGTSSAEASITVPAIPIQEDVLYGTISGLAGSPGSADGVGAAAKFMGPRAVATDAEGNVYVADTGNHTIRKISTSGQVTTIAGAAGQAGTADGQGAVARFRGPWALAVGTDGVVYVADTENHAIRKISTSGEVTILAGSPGVGGSQDGTGTGARFYRPMGIAVDASGTVYVSDTGNHTIRKITSSGEVTVVAGRARFAGYVDGGVSQSMLSSPMGLALAADGAVWVADSNNFVLRKLSAGILSTIAGVAGEADLVNGQGSVARLQGPIGLTTDGDGSVYFSELSSQYIRKCTVGGLVSTWAGVPNSPGAVDGAYAEVKFYQPAGLALDGQGNLYVADSGNSTIRMGKATPSNPILAVLRPRQVTESTFPVPVADLVVASDPAGMSAVANEGFEVRPTSDPTKFEVWTSGGCNYEGNLFLSVQVSLSKDGSSATTLSAIVVMSDDRNEDADGDGLTQAEEEDIYGTSDLKKDTDGDGVNDPLEIADGTNPLDPNSFNSLNKGLAAYYPFNGNAKDASGNGNDASVVGASLTTDRGGAANAAYSFNGGGNYIQLPGNRFLDNSVKVTISAWYRFQGNQSGQIFASGDTRPGYDPYTMRIGPGGFEDLSVADTSAYRTIKANGSLDYRDGVWRHIVMVLKEQDSSASQLLVYLDGCLVTTTNMSPKLTIRYDRDMISQIGAIHADQFWKGQLDDFRFYNRDLSATDVAQLYQQEAGNLDTDGDGLTDAWERGYGRYEKIRGLIAWDNAKEDALLRGGHLLSITSAAEYGQIASALGPNFGNQEAWWIGATDWEEEGAWKWVTGERWSYSPWSPQEPNGGLTENYAHIQYWDPYGWNDAPGSAGMGYTVGYILERGYPTDPTKADTDGDGFDDKVESLSGTDPNDRDVYPGHGPLDPNGDEDGDGLSNGQELTLGTDPRKKDTDSDGVNDPVEIADGTNPLDPNSFNSLNKGLAAYYPFNGNAKDGSGNGKHLTLVGADITQDSMSGGALNFPNDDSHAITSENIGIAGDTYRTVSFWMKMAQPLTYGQGDILGWGPNGQGLVAGTGFQIAAINRNGGEVVIWSHYGDVSAPGLGDPFYNQYNLVTYVYSGSVKGAKFYLNGKSVPLSSTGGWVAATDVLNTIDTALRLGSRQEGVQWTNPGMKLDNIRIYNRALSFTEVGQLYQIESGNLDSDGDGLTDTWERGYGRYQVVPGDVTWGQAKADAEARGGHLVTITSQAEQDFVVNLYGGKLSEGVTLNAIGAYQTSKLNEPSGNWAWVTGETWSYANWNGAPDNNQGNQDYGYLIGNINGGFPYWDDVEGSWYFSRYILEFGYPTDPTKADTDGDGFNDKVESLAGTDPNDRNVYPGHGPLDPNGDEDGDGLTNGQELTLGTNPYQKDSDGDGVNDPVEIADRTDPKDATSYSGLSQGLVAYYDGESLKDKTGNILDLSTKGGAAISSSLNGIAGRAFTLDGLNDGFILPDVEQLKFSSFSIGAWFYWEGQNGQVHQIIFRGGSDPGNDPFSLVINPWSNHLKLQLDHENGTASILESTADMQPNCWNHAMATLDSTSGRFSLYVNGTLVSQTSISLPMIKNLSASYDPGWGIGNHSGNNIHNYPFKGKIDGVRFYSRALSQAAVASLYANDAVNIDSDLDGLTDAWERGFGRYQIVPGTFTWEQAKADAEAKGGHLATFTNASEWNWFLSNYNSSLTANLRIGLEADGVGNSWKWVTREVSDFNAWDTGSGQPDRTNSGEDSVALYATRSNLWHDYHKSWGEYGYVLEFGYPTDPFKPDTDGDGFEDGQETAAQTDPNNPAATPGFEDIVPPTIASLGVQPATVEVSNGPVTAKFSARFRDAISGVSWWSATFANSVNGQTLSVGTWPAAQIQGSKWDGTHVADLVVPRYALAGAWYLQRLHLTDEANNSLFLEVADLTARGLSANFAVVNTDVDSTPPQISLLEVSPAAANVNGQSADLVVRVRVTDAQAGVNHWDLVWEPLSGSGRLSAFGGSWNRISGNEQDGVYETTVTLPAYAAAGPWNLTTIRLTDLAGNTANLGSTEIGLLGLQRPVQVTNPQVDSVGPQLAEVELLPPAVDVSQGAATTKIRLRITDNLSGLQTGNFFLKSPVQNQYAVGSFMSATPLTGTSQDGIYEVEVTIPRYAENGIWRLAYAYVWDATGNGTFLDPTSLEASGCDRPLWVGRATVDLAADADGDGYSNGLELAEGTDRNDARFGPPLITVAGNFQNWSPVPDAFNTMQVVPGSPNAKQLELFFPAAGIYQFKFTRGDWSKVHWGASSTAGVAQTIGISNIPLEITTPGWWKVSFDTRTLVYAITQVAEPDADGDGLSDDWESGHGRYALVGPSSVPASGGVHWGDPGNFTWLTAKADAEARGGHLATVTTPAEWQTIVNRVGADRLYDRSILIGLSDAEEEGTWRWVTGERVGDARWRGLTGEPNGGTTENYVCLPYERFSFGEWVDINLGEISYYLLEHGYPTDGTRADTDSDGFDDLAETLAGTDPNDVRQYPLFQENFASCTSGTSVLNSGSPNLWAGNSNFLTVSRVYSAGGVAKLGTSSAVGSITTQPLDLSGAGGAFLVKFKVRGWTTVEGSLNVSIPGQPAQNVTIRQAMADPFEAKVLRFTGGTANTTVTFSTSGARVRTFLDDIVICADTASLPVNPGWDFEFGFQHINEAGAESYLVSTSNVRKYSEWQSPPLTYWGPTANEVDGALTYRFPASQPIRVARLKASIESYNFPWPGYFGSGKGWSSIWGSKNGSDWVLLLDNPRPTDNVGRGMAYDQQLPGALLGGTDLWIQVRLRVTEAPNSSYTTAQFGRGSSANSQRIFEVKLDYDGLIPETSQAAINSTRLTQSSSSASGYSSSLDSDGDGQTDATELAAGTDPSSANSRFTLMMSSGGVGPAIHTLATGNGASTSRVMTLTWPSVPGKIYTIERSTDLISWPVLDTVEGAAGASSTSYQVMADGVRAFYRVGIPTP